MVFAPVIIPTLNRYRHFKELIESLQENKLAENTEVYISIDFPPADKYVEGYNQICEYVDAGIKFFKKVNVYKQTANLGPFKNNEFLRSIAREQYDRYIFLEDDNIVSPCFLEYMDKSLELIKDDEDIAAVCGYSYPVSFETGGCAVIKEQSFMSAWGYGMFFDKWDRINSYIMSDMISKKNLDRLPYMRKKSPKNYVYYVDIVHHNAPRTCDITYSCYQIFENKFCLMPAMSLVRNNGWDGSGVSCGKESKIIYSGQPISDSRDFNIDDSIVSSRDIKHIQKNEEILNSFYRPDFMKYLKAFAKELVIRGKNHAVWSNY